MDPEDLEIGTDVRPTNPAGIAGPARHHGIDDDPVAGGETGHVWADLLDLAGELVPDDARIAGEGVRSMQDVDVRAADAGAAHADEHLATLWRRAGMLGHGERVRPLD